MPKSQTASQNYKVLIVEDSATMRQVIALTLRRLKVVEVVEAENGLEGLRKISGGNYDLALIDINMPVLDGLKLVSLIRRDERMKDMPIAMITTESGVEDRKRALSLGANEYLTKPLSSIELLRTVRSLLRLS